MWTLTSIVVVFLLVSVGVAALARSNTSRWERERLRRRQPSPPPAAPTGVAGRVGRALATARPTARVRVLQHAAGERLERARRGGVRAVPALTAVLRRVHLEHRHPAQLAARVVHRRGRHRGGRTPDEQAGPAQRLPGTEEVEHPLDEQPGRPGVVGGQ
jgi:hypothetical protein